VVDFGVAKLSAITNLTTLTETGTTMGTPVYMSLEQLSGLKDLDGRADVYSFGAIFYEAVAGQTPYTADSVPELAFKIAAADPEPVLTKRPELPAQLARVIDWAVAREREQRMPDIRTLMRELEVFADDRAFVRDPSDTDTDTSAVPRVGRTSIVPSLNAPLVDAKLQLELQALDAALAPAPRSGLVQVERKPLAEDSLVAKDLPSYYRAPRHSKWRTFALPALGLLVGSAALFAMQETPEVAETTTRAAATAAAGASALQPTAAGAIVSAANDSGVAGLPLAEAAEPVRPAADGATANAAETQRDPSASSIAALPHETMRPQAPPTGSLPAIAAPKPNAPPSAKSQQAQPDVRSQIRSRAAKLLGF
jgi:serine/threonine-protein kinase